MRKKIISGDFSRDAYDIAIGLNYFGGMYSRGKNPEDLNVYLRLLDDISFMQVSTLRSNDLDYLVKGIKYGIEAHLKDQKVKNKDEKLTIF